jgi:uncharacterized protein (DUF3084 family)
MESTVDHIAGVLALFADPAKTKQRMSELLAAMKKFEHAKAENEASLKALHTAQQRLTIERDKVEAHGQKLEQLEKQLAAREAAVSVGERELREKTLRIQHELAERERDISRREAAVPSVAQLVAAEAAAAKRARN